MNRQQFNSRNDIGQVIKFKKSGTISNFNPSLVFTNSQRASWRLFNGSETIQVATNSLSYTGFTSDSAIRNVELRGTDFSKVYSMSLASCKIYGNLDLSEFSYRASFAENFFLYANANLTGITQPKQTSYWRQFAGYNCNLTGHLNFSNIKLGGSSTSGSFQIQNNVNLTGLTLGSSSRIVDIFTTSNCDLTGNLNLPLSGLGGSFSVEYNSNLTGITHVTSSRNINSYQAYNCNLTGNLDVSPLSGLGTSFQVNNNANLTGITHIPSTRTFSTYDAYSCDLTGNLSLPLSGLGGVFRVNSNSGLTSITHAPSSQNFTLYQANSCNLTGNLNLPLSGLGGQFFIYSNSLLTGITHTPSTNIFTVYYAYNCNLKGNLDVSPLSGLGGIFNISNNPLLTGVTHTISSQPFISYSVPNCNITGTHDISMLSNFGASTSASTGVFDFSSNNNLTNILFPATTNFFKNSGNNETQGVFKLFLCNLNYVDFKPLSGATLLTGSTQGLPRISLRDNNMSAGDVNHILDDFKYNATNNPTGWSNVNLNIGGTNADPDSSSGGYNGLSAISTLTGSPYNWTITY